MSNTGPAQEPPSEVLDQDFEIQPYSVTCNCSNLIFFCMCSIIFLCASAYCCYVEAIGEGTAYHKAGIALGIVLFLGSFICFLSQCRTYWSEREYIRRQEGSLRSSSDVVVEQPTAAGTSAAFPPSYALPSDPLLSRSYGWAEELQEEFAASFRRELRPRRRISAESTGAKIELRRVDPTGHAVLQHYAGAVSTLQERDTSRIRTRSHSRQAALLATSPTEGARTLGRLSEEDIGVISPRPSTSRETGPGVSRYSEYSPRVITRSQTVQMQQIRTSLSPWAEQSSVVTRSHTTADFSPHPRSPPQSRVRKTSKKKK